MSTYYEVKEHLQVKGKDAGYETGASIAVNTMQGQPAALAALILTGESAGVDDLMANFVDNTTGPDAGLPEIENMEDGTFAIRIGSV